jgi:uncharacterized integral membrane protein
MAYPPENRPAPASDAIHPLPDELAQTLAGLDPPGDAPAKRGEKPPHTRTGAVWFGVWAGAAALIVLIVFVAQNTGNVRINFLWMDGLIPLALALLIAGVAGAVIAMAVASARILQLRRLLRRR